jgi:hypothetical protein
MSSASLHDTMSVTKTHWRFYTFAMNNPEMKSGKQLHLQ